MNKKYKVLVKDHVLRDKIWKITIIPNLVKLYYNLLKLPL